VENYVTEIGSRNYINIGVKKGYLDNKYHENKGYGMCIRIFNNVLRKFRILGIVWVGLIFKNMCLLLRSHKFKSKESRVCTHIEKSISWLWWMCICKTTSETWNLVWLPKK